MNEIAERQRLNNERLWRSAENIANAEQGYAMPILPLMTMIFAGIFALLAMGR